VRQPAYQNVKYRVATELTRTDFIMRSVFWIGIYPGLSESMLDYVADTIGAFVAAQKSGSVIPVLQS
jgi:CDP-6-deoxy-D-xylo-4-hexulose-3-dehydrase